MTLTSFIILLSGIGVWLIADSWYSVITWMGKPTPTGKPIHDILIRVIRGLLGCLLLYMALVFGSKMIGG